MNANLGFVFPGQGAQKPGMGKDLFMNFSVAKRVFEEADDTLGFSLSDYCFNGPIQKLQLTEITQPAILATSIAALSVLRSELDLKPSVALGHSLGEYSALCCANVISFSDAIKAVHLRGKYMQEAVPEGAGQMAAIMGLNKDKITEICLMITQSSKDHLVEAANFNSHEQTVISGYSHSIQKAIEELKAEGAKRAIALKVSAPFHCTLMEPVVKPLRETLERIKINPFDFPVISNVYAKPYGKEKPEERIVDILLKQLTSPVRFTESIEYLPNLNIEKTLEIGPGTALSSMIKRIDKSIELFDLSSLKSLNKLANSF